MAIIQQHADGIIRDARPTREHKLYPKYMTHPAYQPGTVGQEVRSPGGFSYHVGGTPIRYPPVLVPDADSEEYHASQGYVSHGTSSPEDFARAVQGMPPPDENYRPQEYPKWVGGVLINNQAEEERAAHLRRVQLGIDEPEAEPAAEIVPEVERPVDEAPAVVESNPPPAPEKPADDPAQPAAEAAGITGRMDRLEAAVDEIKLMFVQFMAQRAPQQIEVAVASELEPKAEPPEPSRNTVTSSLLPKSRRKSAKTTEKPPKSSRSTKPLGVRAQRAQQQARHAAEQVAAVMATN